MKKVTREDVEEAKARLRKWWAEVEERHYNRCSEAGLTEAEADAIFQQVWDRSTRGLRGLPSERRT